MALVADLHIHSRFSRATSRELSFVTLHRTALEKGIAVVGTGDFTHPAWLAEIEAQLQPAEEGLFELKPDLVRTAEAGLPAACRGTLRFVLQVEISNIYKKDGRVRKNHNLVYLPSLDAARRFNESLAKIGNLGSDGRPILGLDARDLLEITLETDPLAFLIPAHIWTPWFSMFGSKSGFDSLGECFGDLSEQVFAAETGLSSDPPMNWRLSELDRLTLVSNSDAHSLGSLGREANLLDVELGFEPLRRAIETGEGFVGTVEFYPEEGKYHLDGHRKCGVRLKPDETAKLGGRCPECGGPLTVGVVSRTLELADRRPGFTPEAAVPFERLVPLPETVSQALGVGPRSKRVRTQVEHMLRELGPELAVLREVSIDSIGPVAGSPVAEAVRRVRTGQLHIDAGYDGEFGTVTIFAPGELDALFGQVDLFPLSRVAEKPMEAAEPDSAPTPEPQDGPAATNDEPGAQNGVSSAPATVHGLNPLEQLDPMQRLAAETTAGPILIVAGPGTGKTRTLVARIAHQVGSGAVPPKGVLAIAFTNQAAAELAERILREVPGATEGAPLVTTFHGLGQRLIAEFSGGRPKVLDEDERIRLMRRAVGAESSDRAARGLLDRISLAKQSCDPWEVLSGEPDLLPVIARYQDLLDEHHSLDVDDLVLRAYQILATDPNAASKVSARWTSLCVDEYQDVNDVQAALIELLSPAGETLCAIGDANQSIYGFRGARPGHFVRFEDSFPSTKVIRLETSYRLSEEILSAAQALVGDTAPLRAVAGGPAVEVIACPSPDSEGEQIVVRLERILGGTSYFAVDSGRGGEAEQPHVGFGDVAVLCRTKAQRRQILDALGRSGIPCHSIGEDQTHDPRSQRVAVMTMHASKGREFEVVFVAGIEQGLVPLDRPGFTTDEEEERRLLYVAMTRARRLLVLSHAARRSLWGSRLPGKPSPFLADLPRRGIRHSSPVMPAAMPASRQLRLF